MRRGGWLQAWTRVTLLAGVALSMASAALGATPGGATEPAETASARTVTCRPLDRPFTPRWVTIPHVIGPTKVLALGRNRRGVPLTPPLTDRGKWQFGWDRESGIRPGSRHGVVRLNAHTYPRDGSYGSALGNRLLTRLRPGARLVVSGRDGQRACYKVTRRVRIRADGNFARYYSSTGPPRLAILVCSGRRRGPGDWSHRSIWYAAPRT